MDETRDTPDDEDRVLTKGGEAPDADKAADALPPEGADRKSAKPEDPRRDQGREETFPARDPGSAKHIT